MKHGKIYRLHLRLDYKSNQKLKLLSKKSKCSKSEIIRRLINEFEIKEMPNDEFFDLLNGLVKLGDNLQIIADKAEYLNDINTKNYIEEVNKVDQFITFLRNEFL